MQVKGAKAAAEMREAAQGGATEDVMDVGAL
jgi:hypothetical protein